MARSNSNDVMERLRNVRERTAQARDQRATARRGIDIARKDGDSDRQVVAQTAYDKHDESVRSLGDVERSLLSALAGVPTQHFGSALEANGEALDRLAEYAVPRSVPMGRSVLGPIMSMEDATNLFGGGINAVVSLPDSNVGRRSTLEGISAPPAPGFRLVDFWPSKPMETKSVDYLRRVGVPNPSGGPVATGAVKPEVPVTYDDASAQAEVYAGWVKLNRSDLDDVPALLDDLRDNVLRHSVFGDLEAALIDGDAAFDVVGIRTASGVIAPDLTAAGNLADAVALTLGELTVTGVAPSFVAVNSADYTAEVIRTDDNGQYVNAIEGGRFRATNVPVMQTAALASGEVLAGDAAQAGYIGMRTPPTLLLSDSDGDDFVRNRITALLELRAAIILRVPGALALGEFVAA